MKKITLLFTLFLGFTSLAQPSNDLCSDAINLTIQSSSQECNPVTYSNEGSTDTETYGNSCSSGILNSVWFKFTTNSIQKDLKITLNSNTTDGLTWDFFTDCNGTEATALSKHCFVTYENWQFIIKGFSPNTTYYFRVGHDVFASASGTFGLCIREYVSPPPPVNDFCGSALQLFFDIAYNFNTEGSSTDAITADGEYIYEDAWFKFTAPFNTIYDVTTCGSVYDTRLAVYQANNCVSITDESHIAYNDDGLACGTTFTFNSFTQFVGTAGVDYYIRVGGYDPGDAGDSQILITHPQAGVNEKDLVDFSMAPNPASNNVVLNFDGADKKQISLVDLTGKVISEIEINANQHTLDISSLNKGIYIVKVSSAGGEVIKKLIKE